MIQTQDSKQSGQAIVEYILLLAFIVGTASFATKTLIQQLDKTTVRIGGNLERALKSGRAHVRIWKN